ncbi:vWA domain-containing protein [Cyclobacterium plantarum]|uniref:VWA domain-containing protein n=1 Tax=Cyclobacterium plantarum TaxID=2716263 RepID=A0ABX0HGK3_9BACT|nr:VWA domain-containing protein [Cyclobacterium plantarum]NHE59272.1 VWA domain-containing protein [Cyclobacterium plantarum]
MLTINSVWLLFWAFGFITEGNQTIKETPSPIIFIYDASGSMWGQLQGKTKMEIASEVLSETVETLPENQQFGLVAYGHRVKEDCRDVEFLLEMENADKSSFKTALQAIKPLGMTPLAYAASLVLDQLKETQQKATVILVTDGIESCDGDICKVVQDAKAAGVDFRLHIVGFGLKADETGQLICAAEAGEGQYHDAGDGDMLRAVLTTTTSSTVDEPAGNFSVFAVKNGVPIDAYVKAYDVVAKRQPISVRTYRDTAFFYLPPSTYNFEVQPLEGSDVAMLTVPGVQSFEDKMTHKEISFDSGKIGITTTNNGANWDCIVKVYDQNSKVAASIRSYQEPKEIDLNPGIYKITIQALAMNGIHTYTEIDAVSIPAGELVPVSFDFQTGTAFIDAIGNGKSIDSMVTIKEINTDKNVVGGRTYNKGKEFLLNPGNYQVKVVPMGDFKDRKAQVFNMEVKQNNKISKSVEF